MKKNLILKILPIFLFASILNAQSINIEERVIGVLTSGNSPVIITESNYYQLKKDDEDVWLKYYQKIYNDTTLTNPNLELKIESDIFIIPIVSIDYSSKQLNKFTNLVLLKDIIVNDNFGNLILSSEGKRKIQPFIKKDIK